MRGTVFIGADISIHAAREGGDVYSADKAIYVRISIHAAREGGDPCLFGAFLSLSISIHAAREGGDTAAGVFRKLDKNFNPRRP